jgi:predicted DsbA family dithiol-disulfide isomerase
MTESPVVRVFVWSDYVCPFCYLELPELDRLNDAYGGRVTVDWRAFELRPEPAPTLDPDGEYLHRVWGQSVYPMADQRGMVLRLPPVQPRSRKAHEAAAFARAQGRFDPMHRALFQAFFEEGFDIGRDDVLIDLARSVGLDGDALAEALRDGRHTAQVLADQEVARRMGLGGVPATILVPDESVGGQTLAVSGAQPFEAVASAVEEILARKPMGEPKGLAGG